MNLILSRMVEQFEQKHGKLPKKILIDPLALIVLTHRRSVAKWWKGIPVECREFDQPDTPKPNTIPDALGVIAFNGDLRALDVFTP